MNKQARNLVTSLGTSSAGRPAVVGGSMESSVSGPEAPKGKVAGAPSRTQDMTGLLRAAERWGLGVIPFASGTQPWPR